MVQFGESAGSVRNEHGGFQTTLGVNCRLIGCGRTSPNGATTARQVSRPKPAGQLSGCIFVAHGRDRRGVVESGHCQFVIPDLIRDPASPSSGPIKIVGPRIKSGVTSKRKRP